MTLPAEFIAWVDECLARGDQGRQAADDGLAEVATVALGLARGNREMARALILKDFEQSLERDGRLASSYRFATYPEFRRGRSVGSLFAAFAWSYLLPKRHRRAAAHHP